MHADDARIRRGAGRGRGRHRLDRFSIERFRRPAHRSDVNRCPRVRKRDAYRHTSAVLPAVREETLHADVFPGATAYTARHSRSPGIPGDHARGQGRRETDSLARTAAHYPAERIVLWGESLGSGVAIALSAGHRVGRIVLEGSFTSAADVGASHYRFLPLRLLM